MPDTPQPSAACLRGEVGRVTDILSGGSDTKGERGSIPATANGTCNLYGHIMTSLNQQIHLREARLRL